MSLGIMLFGIGTQFSATIGDLQVHLNPSGYHISDFNAREPYDVAGGITFYTNGTVSTYTGRSGYSSAGVWLIAGNSTAVDIKITKTGGTLNVDTGMANDEWYNLGSDRSIVINDINGGLQSYTGTIYLREAGVSPDNILDSTTITITLESGND